MKLTEKMMLLIIAFSILPIILIGLVVLHSTHSMGVETIETTHKITNSAIADSSESLMELGEQMIKQKAEGVASMLALYLREHPQKTISELQADPDFQSLAVQKVGETGYTAVTDVDSAVCLFHSKEETVGKDLQTLASTLPDFWGIMKESLGGRHSSGYYDWEEPDGSVRQKYMHVAPVSESTADGTSISVAATTYIDEFTQPVTRTERQIESAYDRILSGYMDQTETIRQQLFVVISVVILLLVVFGLMFSHSVTKPIKSLTVSAKQIIDGNLDYPLPNVRTRDEVQELGDAMSLLIGAVKYHQKKPADTRSQVKQAPATQPVSEPPEPDAKPSSTKSLSATQPVSEPPTPESSERPAAKQAPEPQSGSLSSVKTTHDQSQPASSGIEPPRKESVSEADASEKVPSRETPVSADSQSPADTDHMSQAPQEVSEIKDSDVPRPPGPVEKLQEKAVSKMISEIDDLQERITKDIGKD